MRELAQELLAGEDAWVVGGAVRDALLGREVVDLDIACARPEQIARAYATRAGGAPFPLSDRHGVWRVAVADGRTVDFTPLQGPIETDLFTRDFTINAIAEPLAGGELVDPTGGREDLELRVLRTVTEDAFEVDPLRLLRAVRLESELGFRMAPLTEKLVRDHAGLVTQPSGERILAELVRLPADGYRRLADVGLLERLGGSADERLDRADSVRYRLVAAFGANIEQFPISRELQRFARTLLRARPPEKGSARAIHRFRKATEPWALDALAFVGALQHARAVELARENDPDAPLLRGDELGLEPGPEIGRLLGVVEEERAAGTIGTREEALALVERERQQ
jgi:tRNA nucleotidyltransferase/poly(A) polymerase